MTGAVPLRPHMRSNSALEQMRRELVLAFHILNREGQGNEVAGHVTARLPGASTFWTNRFRLGFDEANLADLQECDFDINVKTGGEVNQALLFHSAIYEARPDVNAVVHTHPRNAVALASLGQPLLPLDQQAAIFFENIANYNDHEGVVLGKDEARAISRAVVSGIVPHSIAAMRRSSPFSRRNTISRTYLSERPVHWMMSSIA